MATSRVIALCLLVSFTSCIAHTLNDGYYSDDKDKPEQKACDPDICKPPNCTCFSVYPPLMLKKEEVPQFVMLTFDDAITVVNVDTYEKIANGRQNKGNGCPIGLTFFVCHEYNDYKLTHDLYKNGHEIAVHSITHESSTEKWKTSDKGRWQDEMVGMREILNQFGGIPTSSIAGHRAPFLQTAGDTTFEVLNENNFLYDSSLPTRIFMDPPIWPYTLDHGYSQDCQIRPCPEKSFPGLWVVPMVQFKRISKDKKNKTSVFHCSMADACTPYPETVDDTVTYLKNNFLRHYSKNKAPFPLFLHEAWLRHEERLKGYLKFVDYLLEQEDVFVVTVQEVIDYMKDPVPLSDYKEKKPCFASARPKATHCNQSRNCNFPEANRFMKSCSVCPKTYPWLGNPRGEVQRKE